MKNKHLSILVLSATLCLGYSLSSCKGNNTPPIEQTTKLEFEQTEYLITSGTKVTVKGDVSGVTYSFQGGAPEGVTLNSETGEITYDENVDSIPEKIYIASKGDETASCTIKFTVHPVLPTVSINNVSDYFVSGDRVIAESKTENGTEFAIEYGLKTAVNGISVDSQTGIVTFSNDVKDGTSFTVTATSKTVVQERTFIAMTEHIIGTSTKMQIIKKGSMEEPTFVLDFNGNEAGDLATTKDNISYAINNEITKDKSGISYDESTKTVTIHSKALKDLNSGEIDFKVLTQRNSVSLNLIIADEFIYTANDFYDIFTPNYEKSNPQYKEGSLNGYYVLGADIDLTDYLGSGVGNNSGKGWFPIGAYSDGEFDVPFDGTFNGNGHTISGFWYKKAANVNGLFGRVGTNGVVKNFTLQGDIPEDGVASWSAALVGNNAGTIENVIVDVGLPNGGHSATGAIASVNHGLIKNCLSISTGVNGYNDTTQPWQRAGIAVGLNETDGTVSNVYAVSTKKVEDQFKYNLIGCSNSDTTTNESAGMLFESIDALKEYDFSEILTGDIWNIKANEIPTLNVEFTPLSVGYMKIKNKIEYVLKGNTIEMESLILPSEYQTQYQDSVEYTITGVEGATVNGRTIDFTNVTESGVATVTATLKIGETVFTDSIEFNVYTGLDSVTVNITESYYEAGSTYKLSSIVNPNISGVDVTYKLGSDIGWRKCYVSLTGDTIKIADDIPAQVEQITITATALGVSSEPKVIPIKHLSTLPNSNVIHYATEEALTYDYTLPEGKVPSKVRLADTELTSENFVVENNVLKVKPDLIVAFNNTQLRLTIEDTEGSIYRAFATYDSGERVTQAWITNAFGSDYVAINSMEDFNSYFAYDGQVHAELVDNMKKVYVLNCDLDFSEVSLFRAIGNNLAAADKGVHFTGKFYGMGHTIKNVNISYSSGSWEIAGFFRQVDGGGVVRDLNFENCKLSKPSGNNGGIVCGYLGGEGNLINVNATGCSVTIGDYIVGNNGGIQLGGLAGRPYTTPKYCTFNGYDINLVGIK